MTARFIAQRTLTGEFLDFNVPITEDRYITELSGPGSIEGVIEPEMTVTEAADGLPVISEWDTALYVEEDGQIVAGGLVTNLEWEGPKLTITAPGFATYPTGIPYMGEYLPGDWQDPAAIIADLWAYVQSFPDADLGVEVGGDTTWMRVTDPNGGAFRMFWHEHRDCGEEIGNLLATGPLDFTETHAWNSDKTAITHRINLGFPRIGRRRHDLRFADSENITVMPPFFSDGLEYAQDVYGFGEGEGTAMVRTRIATPNGRVRRVATYFDKTADRPRLRAAVRREHQRRILRRDLRELEVSEHPNAPLGDIHPGDDILVQADVPWLNAEKMWVRVLSVERSTEQSERAILQVQRADAFRYAPVDSPTGDPMPVDLGSAWGE